MKTATRGCARMVRKDESRFLFPPEPHLRVPLEHCERELCKSSPWIKASCFVIASNPVPPQVDRIETVGENCWEEKRWRAAFDEDVANQPFLGFGDTGLLSGRRL